MNKEDLLERTRSRAVQKVLFNFFSNQYASVGTFQMAG
jgi:hypothetical protein